MARYIKGEDSFELYDTQGNVVMEFTGAQLMHWVMAQAAQAKIVLDFADAVKTAARDLYPRHRRLKGQHKPLRTLPTSPHAPLP